MTRMAGQALSGGLAGEYLANAQGGAFEMGNNMGSERAQLASITMDPIGNRKNYIDDGDASVYILNERGTHKRQLAGPNKVEEMGLPKEYVANPVQHAREAMGLSDFPNASDRQLGGLGKRLEYYGALKGLQLDGQAPYKPADLEDLRN
jgi:hypothetical protein